MIWNDLPKEFYLAEIGYPALLLLSLGLSKRQGSSRFELANKINSTVHSTLCTYLAVREVTNPKWLLQHLIYSRSENGNKIIALEAGYLVQDTVQLLLAPLLFKDFKASKLLLFHHITLSGLLLLFLQYARRRLDRGVFFVVYFLLMNASTPVLNARWYARDLYKHAFVPSPTLKRLVPVLDVALVIAFFLARVALLPYMIRIYSRKADLPFWPAFQSLPIQCKMGTTILGFVNLIWWLQMTRSSIRRPKPMKLAQ